MGKRRELNITTVAKQLAGAELPCSTEIKGLMECMMVSCSSPRRSPGARAPGLPCMSLIATTTTAHATLQKTGVLAADTHCERHYAAAVMCMQQASATQSNKKAELTQLLQARRTRGSQLSAGHRPAVSARRPMSPPPPPPPSLCPSSAHDPHSAPLLLLRRCAPRRCPCQCAPFSACSWAAAQRVHASFKRFGVR